MEASSSKKSDEIVRCLQKRKLGGMRLARLEAVEVAGGVEQLQELPKVVESYSIINGSARRH
jgi:hypothetical protein